MDYVGVRRVDADGELVGEVAPARPVHDQGVHRAGERDAVLAASCAVPRGRGPDRGLARLQGRRLALRHVPKDELFARRPTTCAARSRAARAQGTERCGCSGAARGRAQRLVDPALPRGATAPRWSTASARCSGAASGPPRSRPTTCSATAPASRVHFLVHAPDGLPEPAGDGVDQERGGRPCWSRAPSRPARSRAASRVGLKARTAIASPSREHAELEQREWTSPRGPRARSPPSCHRRRAARVRRGRTSRNRLELRGPGDTSSSISSSSRSSGRELAVGRARLTAPHHAAPASRRFTPPRPSGRSGGLRRGQPRRASSASSCAVTSAGRRRRTSRGAPRPAELGLQLASSTAAARAAPRPDRSRPSMSSSPACRHEADRRLDRLAVAVAAAEDPLQHARVLAEAGPQELAVLVLAEPVDVEDPRQLRAVALRPISSQWAK